MTFNRVGRISLFVLAVAGLAVAGIIIFSPYGKKPGFDNKLVLHSVVINAPVALVYNFLGNSDNASKWSVFVHHITPLNTDSFPNGSPGSRRRCFCNADEQGRRWDEVVTINMPNQKRQLLCYNFVDFFISANNLATEQLFESQGSKSCRLTFTVFFKGGAPTIWESFKTYVAAYSMKRIFEQNMDNIRHLIEQESMSDLNRSSPAN